MTTGPDALTDKEKDALRLLLRGHDAKSCARELGLSVHTVNERLREARRKLGTTSSREAARVLLAAEHETTPEFDADKDLGAASEGVSAAIPTPSAPRRWARPRLALTLVGVTAMSLVLAALFLPASPIALTAAAPAAQVPAATSEAVGAASAAEHFLQLIDESKWAESYAATGAEFRRLNTLAVWSDVSARLRPPLGAMLTREVTGNEYVPAPPEGYRLVKFRSTYANGTAQTESVSLAWEDGAWRVAGIVIDNPAEATSAPKQAANPDAIQGDARRWLALIDKGEWQASHAASGAAFRSAVTAEGWAAAAVQARAPLGPVVKRQWLENSTQPGLRDVRMVLFRTDFANRSGATETVTLEREGDGYRVVGYWIR